MKASKVIVNGDHRYNGGRRVQQNNGGTDVMDLSKPRGRGGHLSEGSSSNGLTMLNATGFMDHRSGGGMAKYGGVSEGPRYLSALSMTGRGNGHHFLEEDDVEYNSDGGVDSPIMNGKIFLIVCIN